MEAGLLTSFVVCGICRHSFAPPRSPLGVFFGIPGALSGVISLETFAPPRSNSGTFLGIPETPQGVIFCSVDIPDREIYNENIYSLSDTPRHSFEPLRGLFFALWGCWQ